MEKLDYGVAAIVALLVKECFTFARETLRSRAKRRDEDGGGVNGSGDGSSRIHLFQANQALIQIAEQTKVTTELLRDCRDGHRENGDALRDLGKVAARIEGKIDRRPLLS